ncbi:MAG: PD-(D/E)XK nuclease family protein [Actinobacteria bacterium]|nr:PD-(D/E)XK nuclease family protein [Actinomycetota bacterium]
MSLTPPRTLSPSKVATFTQCALKFRYSAIDKLPEPPSEAATKGTLVHGALERLFALEPDDRTPAAAVDCLAEATDRIRSEGEFIDLHLDEAAEAAFLADARTLVDNYFTMEDPPAVRPIGIELMVEVPRAGYTLRGIIDRLELDDDGELVVSDYKTGRAPAAAFTQRRMDGVKLYAAMCTELLGRKPAKVRLLYLRDTTIVEATPTDSDLSGMNRRVDAIWHAVERSCVHGDFRPKPSRLCDWCAFKAHCPAFGGEVLPPRHLEPAQP